MKLKFSLGVLGVVLASSWATAQTQVYDGHWWLGQSDGFSRSFFASGFMSCARYDVGGWPWTRWLPPLEELVTRYYQEHPEALDKPVREVFEMLAETVPYAPPPPEGGKPCEGPRECTDGYAWGRSTAHGSVWVAGYIECWCHYVNRDLGFPETPAFYAEKISEHYGMKPDSEELQEPAKNARHAIAWVLQGLGVKGGGCGGASKARKDANTTGPSSDGEQGVSV
ncbi:MAG: hypothetical protein ACP5NF_11755, partial [Thermoanaerobaculum sp.]